ncbi:MAG: hypothetical protein FWH40_03670 [Coriobacteriia bacterium]|nr:hypothetical protein [Coriobacteriia bacterium]
MPSVSERVNENAVVSAWFWQALNMCIGMYLTYPGLASSLGSLGFYLFIRYLPNKPLWVSQ